MSGFLYRLVMTIAHRYHWHYAPPIYPNGDVQLWCKWCGFRQTIKRRGDGQEFLKRASNEREGER